MKSNKKTGLLLLGGATMLYLAKNSGATGESSSSGGGSGGGNGGGFVILPSSTGLGEPTAPIYTMPDVIINESALSIPNFSTLDTSGPIAPAPTDSKKTSSASAGISNYQDYDALPDDSPTKKAMAVMYAPLTTSDGGTIKAPYGLGAGGTGIITSPIPDSVKNMKIDLGGSSGGISSKKQYAGPVTLSTNESIFRDTGRSVPNSNYTAPKKSYTPPKSTVKWYNPRSWF